MADDSHVEELIPFCLMDALNAAEAKKVETHLGRCSRCRARYEEQREGAQVLPFAAHPVQPSLRVKRELLARVQADLQSPWPVLEARSLKPRRNLVGVLRAASPALALAAVIGLILALAWALSLREENATLQAQLNDQRAVVAILSSPGTQAKEFKATGKEPNAQGYLYADPNGRRALVVVSGLKPLPADRVYEAWLIKEKTPVGVGTFRVDSSGVGQIVIVAPEPIVSYQIAALTEEPKGGSLQPTTEILMATQF